ncbi:hypothetical protein D3C76_1750920 [compost metagenome]
MTFPWRNDVVGNPAREAQTGLLNRLRGEHRVIDAAQFDADHEDHRQLFVLHPIGERLII